MNQITVLKFRVAFMVALLLAMGFQLWEDDAPKPDPDEPKQYLRPIEPGLPAGTVVQFACPATAAEGGICVTTIGTGGPGGDHTHTLSKVPHDGRPVDVGCTIDGNPARC